MEPKDAEITVVQNPEPSMKWALAVRIIDKEGKEWALGKKFSTKKAAEDAKVIVEIVLRTIIYGGDEE